MMHKSVEPKAPVILTTDLLFKDPCSDSASERWVFTGICSHRKMPTSISCVDRAPVISLTDNNGGAGKHFEVGFNNFDHVLFWLGWCLDGGNDFEAAEKLAQNWAL